MSRFLCPWSLVPGLFLVSFGSALTAETPGAAKPALPELAEYRSPATAIPASTTQTARTQSNTDSYLGIEVAPDPKGGLVVGEVAANSPAARGGLKTGDHLVSMSGQNLDRAGAVHELLHTHHPGDRLTIAVLRQAKPVDLAVTLDRRSHPVLPGDRRAVLGIQIGEARAEGGVVIEAITPGSPAERAKLRVGEILLKIDGTAVTGPAGLRELLARKKPEETAALTMLFADKALDLKLQLGTESLGAGRGREWNTRAGAYWRKDVYRLGVICIEYPDVKHNAKVPAQAWHDAMFSRKSYCKTSATGQPVYGSLADYYQEQSYGTLRVEGKVFNYVTVSKKRTAYAQGNRSALLTEALDLLLARDGKDALKDVDGVFFLYAGDRVPAARGSLYWPHRSTVTHNGRRWPYFICPEGGPRMANISVFCHEFGHLLGLPDLYARLENPGSEGLGVWCAMSNQVGNGRPQQFCAWSKEKLGWLKPTLVDAAVPQKLVLGAVEDSPRESFKILIRADGSEYLLLENRRRKGFDQSLPAEGLLIWRVVQNWPILEESHGVAGPAGPRVFPQLVPFPSTANDSFTPYTTPSSRSQLGGGQAVHITNIRRLSDGRVSFCIGQEYE